MVSANSTFPPRDALSARWICILNLARSRGFVRNPAAVLESVLAAIFSSRPGFSGSAQNSFLSFSKNTKSKALYGPKNISVAPKAYRYFIKYPVQTTNSFVLLNLLPRVHGVPIAVHFELGLDLLSLLNHVDWQPEQTGNEFSDEPRDKVALEGMVVKVLRYRLRVPYIYPDVSC